MLLSACWSLRSRRPQPMARPASATQNIFTAVIVIRARNAVPRPACTRTNSTPTGVSPARQRSSAHRGIHSSRLKEKDAWMITPAAHTARNTTGAGPLLVILKATSGITAALRCGKVKL